MLADHTPSTALTTSADEAEEYSCTRPRSARYAGWLAFLVLIVSTCACSAANLLESQVATPLPTRTLFPTFTATPVAQQVVIIVTPPANGTPGVIIIPPGTDPRQVIPIPPTPRPGEPGSAESPTPATPPSPTATSTETPTFTPTETPTPTPTLTPTPYIVVDSGYVALRGGPSVEFPLVAQLGPGIPIAIVGESTDGGWYQLCCVNGGSVWVAVSHVRVNNNPQGVTLLAGGTPPSPTATLLPTPTGTPTFTPTATPYPFQRTIGPQFFPTDNEFLTIWVKVHIGPLRLFTGCDPDNVTASKEAPAEGYFLKVLFQGFDRPSTNGTRPSTGKFDCSASPGLGNRFEYNLKYEYLPPDPKAIDPNTTRKRADELGTGTWTIYLVDGAGNQLSAAETFTTQPTNNNREVYIGWERVR